MNGTTVLDAFFTYTLLFDSQTRCVALSLPHHGDQSERLLRAMEERNSRTAGIGLKHWNHKCKNCFKTVTDKETGAVCESYYIS